jgi:hypothetical protein
MERKTDTVEITSSDIYPKDEFPAECLNSPNSAVSKNRPYLGKFVGAKAVPGDENSSGNEKGDSIDEDPEDDDDDVVNWSKIHTLDAEKEETPEMMVSPLLKQPKSVAAPPEESDKVHITRACDTSSTLVEATLLAGCYQLDATYELEKQYAAKHSGEVREAVEIFPLGHTRSFTGSQIIQTSKTSLERIFKDTEGRPKVLTCGVYTKQNVPRPPLQITAVAIYSGRKEVFVSITISAMPGQEKNESLLGQQKIVIFTSDSGLPIIEKTFILVPYSYGVPHARLTTVPAAPAATATGTGTPAATEESGNGKIVYPIVPCAYYSHSGVVWYR